MTMFDQVLKSRKEINFNKLLADVIQPPHDFRKLDVLCTRHVKQIIVNEEFIRTLGFKGLKKVCCFRLICFN
jgi:hypothetical protein